MAEKVPVVDVDGTYLEKKRQRLLLSNIAVAPLSTPSYPLHGWTEVNDDSTQRIVKDMPSLSPSTLYTYLAEGVGNAKGSQAFRALKRGYIHWASGRINKLEVHIRHPVYTFVRCSIIPSMRSGTYIVKLMLKKQALRSQIVGNVHQASCECAAGLVFNRSLGFLCMDTSVIELPQS